MFSDPCIKAVAQGDLREHLGKACSEIENRADIEVSVCGFIEQNVEARIHAVFRQPIANHDRDFGKRVQNHGNIGFKLLIDPLAAEKVNDVVKKRGVDIGHLFHRLFTALLKQGISITAFS
jgi:hypothetical protein